MRVFIAFCTDPYVPSPIVENILYFKRGFSSGSSIYNLNSIFLLFSSGEGYIHEIEIEEIKEKREV